MLQHGAVALGADRVGLEGGLQAPHESLKLAQGLQVWERCQGGKS